MSGVFVTSLDFELYWGVRDRRPLQECQVGLLGARAAVPAILRLFDDYGVHATWATVGLLFFGDRTSLLNGLPCCRPRYRNARLSPYEYLGRIGESEEQDPYHYASSVVRTILAHPHQEIATHTFSHYYCLEEVENDDSFFCDLQAAQRAALEHGIDLQTIVFPRNQVSPRYLPICAQMGLRAYRSNAGSWLYRESNRRQEHLIRRVLRLVDSYVNLTGHNCHSLASLHASEPMGIPASRFLRPYSRRWAMLEERKIQRVLSGMTYAAQRGLMYHLWWHPENFGLCTRQNLLSLQRILEHFVHLQSRFGMTSMNIAELSNRLAGRQDLRQKAV